MKNVAIFHSANKVISGALLLLLLAGTASAMPPHDREPDFDRMAERLELDDSQKASFITIMKEAHQEKKAQREATKEKTKQQLASILTEEQLGKMEQAHDRRDERRKEMKGKKRRHCKDDDQYN